MKRAAVLLICITFLFSSCTHKKHSFSSEWEYNESIHYKVCDTAECDSTVGVAEHSFGEEKDEGNGFAVSECTVCGYVKKMTVTTTHSHTFKESYTSDSMYHWHICSECTETDGKEAHIWSENTITTPPTSESQGEAERYCTVCGKFSVVTLDNLPEKINEAAWRQLFELGNVRISERSKTGSVSYIDATHEIDGKLVLTTDKTGASVYLGRRALSTVDFSDYYAYFSHYGDGVYKASGFDITIDNVNQRIQNAVVIINGDRLDSISYSIKLGGFGTVSSHFIFYDFGEVSLCPTYLDNDLILCILDKSNFEGDFTLNHQQNYTETELTVSDGKYVAKTYEAGRLKSVKNGSSASVSDRVAEHLGTILEYLGSSNFVYEDFYEDYTYVGDGTEIPGVGTVINCDIIIEDNRLYSLNLSLNNGTQIFYEFQYNQ